MMAAYLSVIAPIVASIVFLVVQLVSVKVFKAGLTRADLLAYFVGFAGTILYETWFGGYAGKTLDYLSILAVDIVSYTCLVIGYLEIIGLSISLRIRILYILSLSKDGLLPEELSKEFNSTELVERRLRRLLQTKQILKENGIYHVSHSWILALARLNIRIKYFLTGKTSELD